METYNHRKRAEGWIYEYVVQAICRLAPVESNLRVYSGAAGRAVASQIEAAESAAKCCVEDEVERVNDSEEKEE